MPSTRPSSRFDAFRALADRAGRPGSALLDSLARARARTTEPPKEWAAGVSRSLGLPAASGLGPAGYYADLAAPHGRRHVRVCTGTACFAATGGAHLPQVESELGATSGSAASDGEVSVQSVRCLGYCYGGPAALDSGHPAVGADLSEQIARRTPPRAPSMPAADATGDPVLLGGILEERHAWRVWPRAVGTLTPEDVQREVAASGLRGRGGAGFRVAAKWAATAGGGGDTVVVANGDEGDPGSYADRLLMEEDPGRVLEGLALACFACGARRGIVLVRSEYPGALHRLRKAVEQAYADGHLGAGVHGTAVRVDVEIVEGAGSYVAGEETALLAGLEGGRGCARPRPPYPTDRGLWDAPTVVNNVETLASVPWIMDRGGAAYARRGTADEPGTKLVCLSERFTRPGAYEVELGTSLEYIVSELGGGLRTGSTPVVVQVGGPLGGFLAGDALDVPLSDAALTEHGAALGHAGLVAFDDRLEPEDLLRHVWAFAAAESCGACSPCRVGSRRGLEMAWDAEPPGDAYGRLAQVLTEGSLCAFGRRVPAAVSSLARAYGDRLPGWER